MRTSASLAVATCWAALALVASACGTSSSGAQPVADASAESTVDATGGDGRAQDAAPGDVRAGEGSTTPVDAGAGPAFCSATWGALQVAFEGCCPSGDTTTDDYKFIDAIYKAVVQQCGQVLASAIGRGRVTFDPTAAQTCEASVRASLSGGQCWPNIDTNQPGSPLYATPACKGVVTGRQGVGAPCALDLECQDGLTCVGWGSSSDGACAMPGSVGAACEQAADAGSVSSIDWGLGNHPSCASGAYCASSACKAQGAAGAFCGADDECTTGLVCHLGKCGTTGPAAAGGACNGKVDCREGLYCQPGDGGAMPGTCEARLPAGGACASGSDACKGYCMVPDGGKSGVCTAVCGSG